MQTSFTAQQLRDPQIAEANKILETCVHYGFCTSACPTYVVTRDENQSPRGRIDLIKEMLEAEGPPKPETVRHIDSCLSCLSCMSTCAVKVDYAHLVDRARVHIEKHHRRPVFERLLRGTLAMVLTRPRLFGASIILGKGMQHFAGLMPSRLRLLLQFIPQSRRPHYLAPEVFPAIGPRLKRVALLAGCAQQTLNGDINAATIRLLQRHGCDVVVARGAGCCGSLPLHMGKEGSAKRLARANIEAWTRELNGEGLDAIVVNASGCGTTVKDYGHLFAHDETMRLRAQQISALARDLTEIVADLPFDPKDKMPAYRVAYHDPCSMQHGQKVTRQPRTLLRKVGLAVVDVPEKHFCCGSAGTYNLLQPEMGATLGQRKATHIDSVAPDFVATGNIGCMVQIQGYSRHPILHTAEILDWATGGPLPPRLKDWPPPERPAAVEEVDAAPASPVGTGIW